MRVALFLSFLSIFICPIIGIEILTDQFAHSEVKALKSLVRNIIAPNRDLGHTDRALKKEEEEKRKEEQAQKEEKSQGQGEGEQKKECEDCI